MSTIRANQLSPADWTLDELFYRERRQALATTPVAGGEGITGADISALMPALPVLGGGLAVAVLSLAAMAVGVPGEQWLLGLLVTGAMIMLALSVTQERLPLLVVSVINVGMVVVGAWLAASGDASVTRLFVWHLALVAATLLWPPRARDYRVRLWLGAEMGTLVLAAMVL